MEWSRRAFLGVCVAVVAGEAEASAFSARHRRTSGVTEFTNPSGTTGFTRAHNATLVTAAAAFKAGTSDLIVVINGDSNTCGVGAGSGPALNVDLFSNNPVYWLTQRLIGAGIPATDDNMWGNSNLGNLSDFVINMGSRISYTGTSHNDGGTGWGCEAAYPTCIGGYGFNTKDTTSTLSYTTSHTATHMRLYTQYAAGYGTIEYSIDGSVAGTIDTSAGSPREAWVTIALGSEAIHTVTFRGSVVGGKCGFMALDFYNANQRRVRVWCWAHSGGTIANFTNTSYTTHNPHLVIVNLQINSRGSDDAATMTTNMGNYLAPLIAAGPTVWLENPIATAQGNPYQASDIAQAASLGITCIDMTWQYPDIVTLDAAGYEGTGNAYGKHQNSAGYNYREGMDFACLRQPLGV